MKKLLEISLTILFAMSSLFNLELYAQSEVGGIQSGIWSLNKSPYIVKSNIVIPQGLVLKIEAGAVVKFAGNYQLVVRGALIAEGDKTRPIIFTSIYDKEFGKDLTSKLKIPQAGDWQGVEFLDECDDYTTVMNHCIIRYSNWGIHCSASYPLLTNITLLDIEQRALRINNSDYPFEAGQRINPVPPESRPAMVPLPEPAQPTELEKVKGSDLLDQHHGNPEYIRSEIAEISAGL